MNFCIHDWVFEVDLEGTYAHTSHNSADHCTCGYCRNYYDTVDMVYPELRRFLSQFGVVLEGPSELLPFEPTLILASYKVHGCVLRWGKSSLFAGAVPISIGTVEEGIFRIWAGEMVLPWCQDEPEDSVISPANAPEFLEHMQQLRYLRCAEEHTIS